MIKSKNRKSMSINEYKFLKDSLPKNDFNVYILSQLRPIVIKINGK